MRLLTFNLHAKSKFGFSLLLPLLGLVTVLLEARERRIGKLDSLSWSSYYDLGSNASPYEASIEYPDFSPVGALVDKSGTLGTGTLVSPSVVVTAAHLFRNQNSSPAPSPSNWEFVLHTPFNEAGTGRTFEVSQIILHAGWEARLPQLGGTGDGDVLGVDLAVVLLKTEVIGVYPAKLPSGNAETLGGRVVLGGFGNLVDGATGAENVLNHRRVGGVNSLDRIVEKVEKPNVPAEYSGGLLAIDFDSPQLDSNTLGKGQPEIDNLSTGDSNSSPLDLEASTVVGDSGGPAFMRIGDAWRIIGAVSYGSSDSTYGDVTVYTRLANHEAWIGAYLPSWSQARKTVQAGWLQSDWFGYFSPLASSWIFHPSHGWIYASAESGETLWAWQEGIGWWWSGSSVYPFLYSSTRSGWLYLDTARSSHSGAVYYDYSQGAWAQSP